MSGEIVTLRALIVAALEGDRSRPTYKEEAADAVLDALGLEQVGALWTKPNGLHWGLTRLGSTPAFTNQEHLTDEPVYVLRGGHIGSKDGAS